MAASGSQRGYSSREIRDYVAAVDLPKAAFAARAALDKNAHAQLANGIVMGMGVSDVDPARAARVCECLSELLLCPPETRREAAAHALTAAMKAVVRAGTPVTSLSAAYVNSAGADINMAQPCPERAAAYALVMSKTMRLPDVADSLAKACARVTSLHGAARNAGALTAFARCPLFAKATLPQEVSAGGRALLFACVRAAYVRDHVRDEARPELIAALTKNPPVKATKKAPAPIPDDPFTAVGGVGDPCRSDVSTEDKLAVIWTFVTKDSAAVSAVPHASQPDPDAGEIRVVAARDLMPDPRNPVAKVRHLQ
jgi:hypothetical protein